MVTSVELGIFDALASGPQTCAALAAKLPATADALERLLASCVHLQLLKHATDGRFANTPTATAYLTTASPS